MWLQNLDLGWPEALFDDALGTCLTSLPVASRPADYHEVIDQAVARAGGRRNFLKRAADYNLLMGQALAKANEVQVHWRLSNEVLTMDRFKRDYETAGSRTDFIAYFRAKIIERHRKEEITNTTRKNHFSSLNALAAFRLVIPFHSFTTDFADEYHRYAPAAGRAVGASPPRGPPAPASSDAPVRATSHPAPGLHAAHDLLHPRAALRPQPIARPAQADTGQLGLGQRHYLLAAGHRAVGLLRCYSGCVHTPNGGLARARHHNRGTSHQRLPPGAAGSPARTRAGSTAPTPTAPCSTSMGACARRAAATNASTTRRLKACGYS